MVLYFKKIRSRQYPAETITDADYSEFMYFKQGVIFTLRCRLLELIDKFTYLGSNISSTERDVNIHRAKAWTTINRLSIIGKSDLSSKIKEDIYQAVAVSVLLYAPHGQ